MPRLISLFYVGRQAGTDRARLEASDRAEDRRARPRLRGSPAAADPSAQAERLAIEHDYGRWMIHGALALLLLPALLGVLIVGGTAVVILWLGETVAGLWRSLESTGVNPPRR